jgi:methionyl-tRNA formyltransferase
MFVCIAGKHNIAIDVTEYLLTLNRDIELGVMFNRTETGVNAWQNSFQLYAKEKGIREYQLEEIYNRSDVVFLSLEFDRIIKPEKFKDARLYNLHFSLLPSYKGMYTSIFPILNNEKKVGVTLHQIDHGIDTGDIIAQQAFELTQNITSRELYFLYIQYGTNLVIQHLEEMLDNKVSAIPQPAEGSSYYAKNRIDFGKIDIELNDTAQGIHNQIRAYHFREYQLPCVYHHKIIGDCITNVRSCERPGTIRMENSSVLLLATVDYDILLYKDRYEELLTACEGGH